MVTLHPFPVAVILVPVRLTESKSPDSRKSVQPRSDILVPVNQDGVYRKVCTEAGYFAIRDNRTKVTRKDFLKGIDKVKQEEQAEGEDYLNMFG